MNCDFTLRHTHEFLDPTPDPRVDTAIHLLHAVLTRLHEMTPELQRLTDQVAATNTIMASAATLIGGLADQIRALKDDPAALAKLADDLDAGDNALAEAVAANTPAAAEGDDLEMDPDA
jgi:ABC-type transporter Mla subunit MlaD